MLLLLIRKFLLPETSPTTREVCLTEFQVPTFAANSMKVQVGAFEATLMKKSR